MSYSVRVTMTAPLELADICAGIARGMDTDEGGESAFYCVYPLSHDSKKNPLPAQRLETAFWAVPEFAAAIEYLLADPVALQASVALDYSMRWANLTPPTVAECRTFCTAVAVSKSIHSFSG